MFSGGRERGHWRANGLICFFIDAKVNCCKEVNPLLIRVITIVSHHILDSISKATTFYMDKICFSIKEEPSTFS